MNKCIVLNNVNGKVVVNVDSITAFEQINPKNYDNCNTCVYINGDEIMVKETIDQIMTTPLVDMLKTIK